MADILSSNFPTNPTYDLIDNCFTADPGTGQWRRSTVTEFFDRIGITPTIGTGATTFSGKVIIDADASIQTSTNNNTFAALSFKQTSGAEQGYIAINSGGQIDLNAVNELRFRTGDTERLKFSATGEATFNGAFTFPITDGGNDNVLTSDGVGNVVWTTKNASGTVGNLQQVTDNNPVTTNGATFGGDVTVVKATPKIFLDSTTDTGATLEALSDRLAASNVILNLNARDKATNQLVARIQMKRGTTVADGEMLLRTAKAGVTTTALLLDEDANATFAGKAEIKGGTVGSGGVSNVGINDLLIDSDANTAGINIMQTNLGAGYLGFGDPEDSFVGGIFYQHITDSLNLYANNATRLAIRAEGDIAMNQDFVDTIGADIPTFQIMGRNATNGGGIRLSTTDQSAEAMIFIISSAMKMGSFTNHQVDMIVNNIEVATFGNAVLGTGVVYSNNRSFTSVNPSDARLKNIKGEYTEGLSTVLKFKTHLAAFKSEPKLVKPMFIAQEVQEFMPNAVEEFDAVLEHAKYKMVKGEKKEISKAVKGRRLGFNCDMPNPMLVNAIQELHARIEALEAKA